MSVIENLKDKKILIWGYGREGQSTRQFLKRCCEPSGVEVFEGKREEIDEDKYDLIIKSPGIPTFHFPLSTDFCRYIIL